MFKNDVLIKMSRLTIFFAQREPVSSCIAMAEGDLAQTARNGSEILRFDTRFQDTEYRLIGQGRED